MSKTCITCPFFNGAAETNVEEITQGECRVSPPTVHVLVLPGEVSPAIGRVVPAQQTPARIVGQSVFPTVAADCWCAFHPDRELGRGLKHAMNSVSGFPVNADL